jgi:HD-like signal output (HDOD) protein
LTILNVSLKYKRITNLSVTIVVVGHRLVIDLTL